MTKENRKCNFPVEPSEFLKSLKMKLKKKKNLSLKSFQTNKRIFIFGIDLIGFLYFDWISLLLNPEGGNF